MELDWRSPNAYQALTDGLSHDQWRWEFLRRRNDYRRDWQGEKDGDTSHGLAYLYDLDKLIDPASRGMDLNSVIFTSHIAYRLTHEKSDILRHFSKNRALELDRKIFVERFYPIVRHAQNAVYVFDLSKPLDEQVSKVTNELRSAQKDYEKTILEKLTRAGRTKPRRGAHPELMLPVKNKIQPKAYHLRALDARALGVTFAEIGRVLFNAEDSNAASNRARREYKYATQMWELLAT